MTQATCPSRESWQQHLRGSLPPAEETQLSEHLQGCAECQRMLETLTAPPDSLLDVARAVGQEPRTEETALRRALGALRSDTVGTDTKAWTPGGGGPAEFPYLGPPAEAGHLGRLAHYEVLEVLGRGGMGVVFKAHDDKLNRIVAVKVLGAQYASSEQARKRFEREAQSAAQVSHDHVVPIYHVDECNGVAFLVMPLIAGKSLQDRLDADGPLPLLEILRIGQEIAQGLAAAHAQGLVHRDIKPANILLEGDDRRVKITDFGLARAVDDASLSQSGVVAGTPMYMSPEQAAGRTVDHRSDLFSLGSVFYAMATGTPPFHATGSLAVLKRVSEEEATPISRINPDIPDWFDAIVAKLHAKRPWERFDTAAEVAELLGGHLAHLAEPTRVPAPAPVPRPSAPRAARRSTAAVVVVVVLVGFCGLGVIGAPVVFLLLGASLFMWQAPQLDHAAARGELMHADPFDAADIQALVPLGPGWRSLFNRQNLDGWQNHPTLAGAWRVENGLLVGSEPGGVLLSQLEFGDGHFRIEAKVLGPVDAAQLVRCDREAKVGAKTPNGDAFNHPRGLFLPMYESTDNDALVRMNILPGYKNRLPQDGIVSVEWNRWFTREIIVRDKQVQIKLNDRDVGDFDVGADAMPGKHLALQLIRGTIMIRRIDFKLLDEPNIAPPAKG